MFREAKEFDGERAAAAVFHGQELVLDKNVSLGTLRLLTLTMQLPQSVSSLLAAVVVAASILTSVRAAAPGISSARQQSIVDVPVIQSVRGKVVTVEAPAGFSKVTLERWSRVPGKGKSKAWQPLETKIIDGQAGLFTFKLRTVTPKRLLRIAAEKQMETSAALLTGITQFLGEVDSPDAGSLSVDANVQAPSASADWPFKVSELVLREVNRVQSSRATSGESRVIGSTSSINCAACR